MACAAAGGHSPRPYSKLKSLLDEMGPALRHEPPPALRQLAENQRFTLYVSTTFDSLLSDTLASPAPHRTTRTSGASWSPRGPARGSPR